MKFDYCYVSALHGDNCVVEMANHFKKRGKSFLVITENDSYKKLWQKHDVESVCIFDMEKATGSAYREFETAIYDKVNSEQLYMTEKSYYSLPSIYYKYKVKDYLKRLFTFLEKYKVGSFLQRPGGEIIRQVFFALQSTEYVNRVYCFGESYIEGKSVLYHGDQKELIKADNSDSQVREYESQGVITYDGDIQKIRPSVSFNLFNLLRSGCLGILLSYFTYIFKTKFVGSLRNRLLKLLFVNKDSIESEKAIFFPLNVQAESELYVRNYQSSNQYEVLEKLQKMLPDNYSIYVKAHPGNSKSLSLVQYLFLRFKGINILKSELKVSEVFRKETPVAAISSTVLFEAIQAQVPIIVLGNWAYSRKILGRYCELNNYDMQKFIEGTSRFKVNKEYFNDKLSNYLYEGSIYSGIKELQNLIDNIIKNDS